MKQQTLTLLEGEIRTIIEKSFNFHINMSGKLPQWTGGKRGEFFMVTKQTPMSIPGRYEKQVI